MCGLYLAPVNVWTEPTNSKSQLSDKSNWVDHDTIHLGHAYFWVYHEYMKQYWKWNLPADCVKIETDVKSDVKADFRWQFHFQDLTGYTFNIIMNYWQYSIIQLNVCYYYYCADIISTRMRVYMCYNVPHPNTSAPNSIYIYNYACTYVTFYAKRDHVPELVIFSSKPKFLTDLCFVNSEISVFS